MELFLSLLQWVQEKYKADSWMENHDHLLEYNEPDAENLEPYISVRVAEPADDDERNWKVSIIGTSEVSCTRVLDLIIFDFLLHIIAILTYLMSHTAFVFPTVQESTCR